LFYVYLVAIISLGSTGFTTVEEMGNRNDDNAILCGLGAQAVFEQAAQQGVDSGDAAEEAQLYYNMCTHFGFFDL